MINLKNDCKNINADEKEIIFQGLRNMGCRITPQRRLIVEIILEDDFSCCKEIYYKVKKRDPLIGISTVYRMISILEEVGVINRHNLYKIPFDSSVKLNKSMNIVLKSKKKLELTVYDLKKALLAILADKGIILNEEIDYILIDISDKNR